MEALNCNSGTRGAQLKLNDSDVSDSESDLRLHLKGILTAVVFRLRGQEAAICANAVTVN